MSATLGRPPVTIRAWPAAPTPAASRHRTGSDLCRHTDAVVARQPSACNGRNRDSLRVVRPGVAGIRAVLRRAVRRRRPAGLRSGDHGPPPVWSTPSTSTSPQRLPPSEAPALPSPRGRGLGRPAVRSHHWMAGCGPPTAPCPPHPPFAALGVRYPARIVPPGRGHPESPEGLSCPVMAWQPAPIAAAVLTGKTRVGALTMARAGTMAKGRRMSATTTEAANGRLFSIRGGR